MKKILTSVCAIAIAITALVVPAQADNSEEVIIGILGGALGGLIIGEALSRPRYAPAPVYAEPIYIEPQPQYVRECYVKVVRRYDPAHDRYVKVKRKVCEVVPKY